MDTKIVEERYAILKSIKNGGNKDQILMENGWSIDQYKRWLERFEEKGMLGLFNIPVEKKIAIETIREVVVLKKATGYTTPELSALLQELKIIDLSERSIIDILNEYCEDPDKAFKDEKMKLEIALKDALNSDKAKEIGKEMEKMYEAIREWKNGGVTVKEVCSKYGILCHNFYKYERRFEKYGLLGLVKEKSGQRGRRTITLDVEIELVKRKLENRKVSHETLAEEFDKSPMGVWKVLNKYNLTKRSVPETLKEKHEKPKQISTISKEIKADKGFIEKIKYHSDNNIPIMYPGLFILAIFLKMLNIEKIIPLDLKKKQGGVSIGKLILININRILAGFPRINRLEYLIDDSLHLSCGMASLPAQNTIHVNKFRITVDRIKEMRIKLAKYAAYIGLIKGEKLASDPHLTESNSKKFEELNIGEAYDTTSKSVKRGFRPMIVWDIETNSLYTYVPHNGSERGPKVIVEDIKSEVAPIKGNPALILLDREFTSVPVINALYDENGIHVIEAVRKHKGVKKLLDNIEKNKLWTTVDDQFDIAVKPIDIKENIFLVAKRDKVKNKIWCFETTIKKKSNHDKKMIEIDKKKSVEENVLEFYRFRWQVENGIDDLCTSYFMDKVPTSNSDGVDFHYWCVMASYFTVKAFKRWIGDIGAKRLDVIRDMFFRGITTYLYLDRNTLLLRMPELKDKKLQTKMEDLFTKLKQKGLNGPIPWMDNLYIDVEFCKDYYIKKSNY
jgi:transposase